MIGAGFGAARQKARAGGSPGAAWHAPGQNRKKRSLPLRQRQEVQEMLRGIGMRAHEDKRILVGVGAHAEYLAGRASAQSTLRFASDPVD
jgi:hypothetical protein